MTPSQGRSHTRRASLTLLTALGTLAGAALTGAAPAGAATGTTIAAGVVYRQYDLTAGAGVTHVHVLAVDLTNTRVRLGLLHAGKVASRATITQQATAQKAVAGVNGDFFNITETQHPGVAATGASVGPAIADGRVLKAAVPTGQRFGPELPPGTDTDDVLGGSADGRARLDSLALTGTVTSLGRRLPLRGLNQYALAENSVGAYTSDWGGVSRARAACGTDSERAAPCSTRTYEVTVKQGRVVSASATPGSGAIAAGTTVLVGREAGAQHLKTLVKGDRVAVRYGLAAASQRAYRFALGGYPVLTGGKPLPGLDTRTSAVRTAVGIANGGQRVLLFAVDGAPAYRSGLTIAEVAAALKSLGATEGFSLDGGGSSTLVARAPGAAKVSVRNHPSDGTERAVPNGIGVFTQ
ncbi:phosphodiester glycosidase family protein [Streptomyces phaeoluteigriseus]|uniref:Phosphodiester glycosidase family protein n=1 Tax=Streptomyces phaeoluteigriseus TaxID=114686 RepID=A0ABY4ZF43_9ACTN|nr:phosphodiester glycosidase family protein [Streptomyces phaeoluteigriseus]USQ86907.1 phosphodiester glycosidase family protein [Streptomyces phaeoluteigriseus]